MKPVDSSSAYFQTKPYNSMEDLKRFSPEFQEEVKRTMGLQESQMDFHRLTIRKNRVYLDDAEVKGVHGYELEQYEGGVPLLKFSLYIEPDVVVNK